LYGFIAADNSSSTGGGIFAAYQNGTLKTYFAVTGAIEGNTSSDAGIFADSIGGGIRFYTNASPAEKARIDSSGRFGIGDTNPQVRLSVLNGTDNTDVAVFSGGDRTRGLKITTGAAGGFNDALVRLNAQTSTGQLAFSVNSNEAVRIDNNSRLLIGTTSTSYGSSGAFINRVGGTNNPGVNFRGGGWSIYSIGGEPALVLSTNINASGLTTSAETARGGIGFEYVNSSEPTRMVIGTVVASTVPCPVTFWTEGNERARIDSSGRLLVGDVLMGTNHIDIMKMWRTADIQGYTNHYGDGGGVSYTWDNGTVRVDTSIGSHGWDIGKVRLPVGIYQLYLQYRPSPTQHGWNVYGTNSNGHHVDLISDAGYGSFSTFLAVYGQLNKDVGYSYLFKSETYTVFSETTYRINMKTQPYGTGGYKYFVEASYLIKIR
jgi:hypothetical protein